MVEEVRPGSYRAGGGNPRVDVRTLNDNNLWVGRTSPSYQPDPSPRKEGNMKGNKTLSSSQSNKSWWNDPEFKRKRRVAQYKFYTAEGKIKRSLKKGFRWLKIKCIKIVKSI